jgi:hypothetical protein
MKNWHFGIYDPDNDGERANAAATQNERAQCYALRAAERKRDAKQRAAAKADPNVVVKTCENCGNKQRSHITNRLIKCKNCIDS